jgi:restriction endonuclease
VKRITQAAIRKLFMKSDAAATVQEKGRTFENLICEVFEALPGIELVERNALNAFSTEEVDVALWNRRSGRGLYFFPHVVLIECKNWSGAVGSQEVAYFADRLRHRGCDFGILVAANGVTGDPQQLAQAHFELAIAASQGQRIVVLTRQELEAITSSADLIALIKRKLCQVVVSGTVV